MGSMRDERDDRARLRGATDRRVRRRGHHILRRTGLVAIKAKPITRAVRIVSGRGAGFANPVGDALE